MFIMAHRLSFKESLSRNPEDVLQEAKYTVEGVENLMNARIVRNCHLTKALEWQLKKLHDLLKTMEVGRLIKCYKIWDKLQITWKLGGES